MSRRKGGRLNSSNLAQDLKLEVNAKERSPVLHKSTLSSVIHSNRIDDLLVNSNAQHPEVHQIHSRLRYGP